MGFCFVVMSDCQLSCVVYVYCEIVYCSVLFECQQTLLAQLVERTTFNRVVVGSIPTWGEIFILFINTFIHLPTYLSFYLPPCTLFCMFPIVFYHCHSTPPVPSFLLKAN